jgi:exonuclease VII small subunit
VHLWMIDQHLGRRSLSDFQRGVLALRKREIVAERLARTPADAGPEALAVQPEAVAASAPASAGEARETTREALARVARLSSSQVMQIEKIQKQAAPEVVAAVKAGEISIHAAATVASLPWEDQVAAATGGKEELKQAAKRVRESRKRTAVEPPPPPRQDEAGIAGEDTIDSLRQRVADLTAENMQLREQLAQLQRGAAGK